MASRLTPKNGARHNRGFSHAGVLGGCVATESRDNSLSTPDKSKWHLRSKKRPASLQVSLEERGLPVLSTMTPNSVVVHSAKLPGDANDVDHSEAVITGSHRRSPSDKVLPELPLTIRCDVEAKKSHVLASHPQTRQTPEDNSPEPIELPGSILLPHQGFPQHDAPLSPATVDSTNSTSDGSRRSPTTSVDTSATSETEMELLRTLTSSQQKLGKLNAPSAVVFGRTKKPFQAMTADELIECLPGLTKSVVSHSWVPAMQDELKRIRGLLQEAAEMRLQSQAELKSFGQDVNSIAVSARDISRAYFDVMQRVGPLVDRDAKAVCEQLEATEAELRIALATVEDNKKTLSDKEDLIQRLHETLAANSHIFGGFIQDHAASLLGQLQDVRTQEIRNLIKDQEQHLSENRSVSQGHFVWIPEKQYKSYVERLRNMQQQVESYGGVAKDQLNLIQSQSADLDRRLREYEKYMTVVDQRQSQILDLESTIAKKDEDITTAEGAARQSSDAHDALKIAHEGLKEKHADLEQHVEGVKGGFRKQLEDKNTEIFTLRQRLGEIVLETANHKAEATAAVPMQKTSTTSPRFRNPLGLGKGSRSQDDDDGNPPIHARRALLGKHLPASQSMLCLGTGEPSLKADKGSGGHSSPSPINNQQSSGATRPRNQSFAGRSSGKGSRIFSGLRMNPPDSISPLSPSKVSPAAGRQRTESMRSPATTIAAAAPPRQNSTTASASSPRGAAPFAYHEKALPRPPVFSSEHINVDHDAGGFYSNGNGNGNGDGDGNNNNNTRPGGNRTTPTTPVRMPRILRIGHPSPGIGQDDLVADQQRLRPSPTDHQQPREQEQHQPQEFPRLTSNRSNNSDSNNGVYSNPDMTLRNNNNKNDGDSNNSNSNSSPRSTPSTSSSDQAALRRSMALLDQIVDQEEEEEEQQQQQQQQ